MSTEPKSSSLKEYLELLTKLSASTAIILLVLGYANLHSFYSYFNIEIYRYLDTTEIPLSLVSLFFPLLINLLIYSIGFSLPTLTEIKNQTSDQSSEARTIVIKQFYNKSKRGVSILLLNIIIVIPSYEILIFSNFNAKVEIAILMDFVVLVMLPTTLAYLILLRRKTKIYLETSKNILPGNIIYRIVIVISIGCGMIALTQRQYIRYTQIINRVNAPIIELTLNDNTKIVTDSTFVFINATRNYMFFRNLKTNQNTIIPIRNINIEKTIYPNKH